MDKLKIGSAGIFYEYIKGKSPCIVFIHGLGANCTAWQREFAHFQKKGYSALRFDLRGHGMSSKITPKFNDFSRDLFALVRINRLKKIILVGHSMGGLITCDASRIVPELVATATFLGTPFGGTQKARLGIGKSAEQLLPGSAYLQRLLEDGLPEEIKYTVVQGTRDEVVSEERSRLPLEQENITHYRIATGHLGLAGKKGYKVVKLALAGGEKSQIDLDQIHHGPGN